MTDAERDARQEQAWAMLEDVSSKVSKIHDTIYVGNGKPSIMVRMDRLEQRTKLMWGTAVAIASKVLHNSFM